MKPIAEFFLPYPPSANTYWRSMPNSDFKRGAKGVRVLLSEDGRAYKKLVRELLVAYRARGFVPRDRIESRVRVDVLYCPRDDGRRDGSNLWKALLDSLSPDERGRGGLWRDDSLVEDDRIRRGPKRRVPYVLVRVWELPAFPDNRELALQDALGGRDEPPDALVKWTRPSTRKRRTAQRRASEGVAKNRPVEDEAPF